MTVPSGVLGLPLTESDSTHIGLKRMATWRKKITPSGVLSSPGGGTYNIAKVFGGG